MNQNRNPFWIHYISLISQANPRDYSHFIFLLLPLLALPFLSIQWETERDGTSTSTSHRNFQQEFPSTRRWTGQSHQWMVFSGVFLFDSLKIFMCLLCYMDCGLVWIWHKFHLWMQLFVLVWLHRQLLWFLVLLQPLLKRVFFPTNSMCLLFRIIIIHGDVEEINLLWFFLY